MLLHLKNFLTCGVCAGCSLAATLPVPCCAKFYGIPGPCSASLCPNKNSTAAACKQGCADGDDNCRNSCDTWICRDSIGYDGAVQAGKIDCIAWGGLVAGVGIFCPSTMGTAIKMSDNNGVGCPGFTGQITGFVACEREIGWTSDPNDEEKLDEAACKAVGCCQWTGSKCDSAIGDVSFTRVRAVRWSSRS